jgi:hypothetical protein
LLIAAFVVGVILTIRYPITPSPWRCLALAFAGPTFQLLILSYRQWWEKNLAHIERKQEPDGVFLAIHDVQKAVRSRQSAAAQRLYVWVHRALRRANARAAATEDDHGC